MKKSRFYIEVRISGTAPLAELLGASLFELSAEGIEERPFGASGELDWHSDYGIADSHTEPPTWANEKRTLYCAFEDGLWEEILPQLEQLIQSFRAVVNDLTFEWERLPSIDSVMRWKNDLKAILISDKIGIAPTRKHIVEDHRKWLVIPPKMAFGTGEHPTTRMAAQLVSQWTKEGDVVLDAGCGTGILALTALLFGADFAVGVDIEEDAIREAKLNARRNHFTKQTKWICGSILEVKLPEKSFDFIVANIHLHPLKEWWNKVPKLLKPNGRVVVTGLLCGQGKKLGRALGKSTIRKQMGPWIALGYDTSDSYS